MNFIDAVKQLHKNNRLRRKEWDEPKQRYLAFMQDKDKFYIYLNNGELVSYDQLEYYLCLSREDVMAEDWYVYMGDVAIAA